MHVWVFNEEREHDSQCTEYQRNLSLCSKKYNYDFYFNFKVNMVRWQASYSTYLYDLFSNVKAYLLLALLAYQVIEKGFVKSASAYASVLEYVKKYLHCKSR